MKSRMGTICMLLGAVLMLAALSLFLWNQYEDQRAGASAEQILSQMRGKIEGAIADSTSDSDPYGTIMPETQIDGDSYIGYLSIPTVDLNLPVMSEWDDTRLKTAPCRYTGSTRTDDLVIAGHNYPRHFGTLSKLSVGDRVCFTGVDGISAVYEVAVVETLASTDVGKMTAGNYDLTLFTCTYSGQNRVTVRCVRIQGNRNPTV